MAAGSAGNIPPDAAQETFIPIFTYPPFPPVPEGVTITPFKDFKPSGIKKFLDPSEDDIELDGIGVPTAELLVRHAGPDSDKWKKKKKIMGVGEDDAGKLKRYYWWEEWEKDEAARTASQMSDLDLMSSDRLIQAAIDFRAGRTWPQGSNALQAVFDAFRLFVGLLSRQPQSASKKKTLPDDESDDDDPDGDDEIGYNSTDKNTEGLVAGEPQVGDGLKKTGPRPGDEEQEEDFARVEEANERSEARLNAFLDDPETKMAIFFSSHFRNKGAIWSESRCRDGPRLLSFFIGFLLRNKVFPERVMEQRLRKALDVVSLAITELPASFAIARLLPDDFSEGCNQLWGSQIEIMILGQDSGTSEGNIEWSRPKGQKIAEEDLDERAAETIAQVEEQKVDIDPVESSGLTSWGNTPYGHPSGGWGDSWGTSSPNGHSVWGDQTDSVPYEGATWDIGPVHWLMESLGPTSLPLTHTTGIVETSTRRIVSISPPTRLKSSPESTAEAVENELAGTFCKMVLGPWIGWDKNGVSDLAIPVILPKSRGEVVTDMQNEEGTSSHGSSKRHDPFHDRITVLISPVGSEKLLTGVGLGATWIQIARMDEDGNPVSGGPDMWYLERLTQIIPSYYTDP